MTDSKLRTPDGRVIRAAAGDETVAAYPDEEGVRAMKPFFDACQAVLSDRPVSAGGRLGLFLFQLGAADRFWHRHNLDDHRFPAFAAQLLQSQAGVGASEAVAISTALPQLRGVAAANAVIAEGAAVIDTWLDSHDPNAVLCLTELLPRWENLPDLMPGKT